MNQATVTRSSEKTLENSGDTLKWSRSTEEATVFALASSTIGIGGGFITGAVTGIMKNLANTPQLVPHILKTIRFFGLMGVVHGLVGAIVISRQGFDDYWNRAISGCSAGVAIGLTQRNVGLGCGMCLTLASFSMLEKATQQIFKPNQVPSNNGLVRALEPRYISDDQMREGMMRHFQSTIQREASSK